VISFIISVYFSTEPQSPSKRDRKDEREKLNKFVRMKKERVK